MVLPSARDIATHLAACLRSQDEFKVLFEMLDLDITENQKENLFAFCDADCSGDIDEKEFTEGWDMMVEVSTCVGSK